MATPKQNVRLPASFQAGSPRCFWILKISKHDHLRCCRGESVPVAEHLVAGGGPAGASLSTLAADLWSAAVHIEDILQRPLYNVCKQQVPGYLWVAEK